MHASTGGRLAMEPQVNVAAMAEIIKELVAGEAFRLQDGGWLCRRAEAAGLGTHEYAALEALRVRLCERGATLQDTIEGPPPWN